MKQGLSLKFSQNLALTPALQQAIKLLQMSQLELQDALLEQVETNPFLDWQPPQPTASIDAAGVAHMHLAHDFAQSAGMQSTPLAVTGSPSHEASASPLDSQIGQIGQDNQAEAAQDWEDSSAFSSQASDGRTADANDNADNADSSFSWIAGEETTLLAHLQQQARLLCCSPQVYAVLHLLLEAVTPEGYLDSDLSSIQADIARALDVAQDEAFSSAWLMAYAALQGFDPPGVGARSLQECLHLQLVHPCAADCVLDSKTSVHALALRVVAQAFDALALRDRAAIKKMLKCDDEPLAKALQLIRRLDPKPGLVFAPAPTEYVQPEILVRKLSGAWQARLNPAVVPALRVQETHAKFIKRGTVQTDALYQQLQGARQLVRTLQQHFETVFRVGQAIVASQQAFFEMGAIKLKPMGLKSIADSLGLHESTVSRVTTRKYLQTPHGVLEMKYFFSSALTGDDGEDASSTAIKAHLMDLLKGEPPHKPLSDQAMADALNAQGFNVARRTVAKYREALGFASAHARKPL